MPIFDGYQVFRNAASAPERLALDRGQPLGALPSCGSGDARSASIIQAAACAPCVPRMCGAHSRRQGLTFGGTMAERAGDLVLTYAELAERLGIAADGARMRAKRRSWRTVPGND